MKINRVYLLVFSVFTLAACCLFIDVKGNEDLGVYEEIFDVLTELPVNTEGWTEITSSPDTRVIYVSSSIGDDSNSGLSEDTAVASVEKGYSLLRSEYPDPSSSDYDPSFDAPAAFTIKGDKNQVISDILLEDCRFRYYGMGLVVQNYMATEVSDIKLRRSVISDNYSISSHSQGFYAHAVNGLLIEECLFDHNGWLIQGEGQNTIAGGRASMFNHNT